MIAAGVLKDVTFETEGIMPSNGNLNIKLNIYKGTNNLGCFYGLTGITLKGVSANLPETGVDERTENRVRLFTTLQAAR